MLRIFVIARVANYKSLYKCSKLCCIYYRDKGKKCCSLSYSFVYKFYSSPCSPIIYCPRLFLVNCEEPILLIHAGISIGYACNSELVEHSRHA